MNIKDIQEGIKNREILIRAWDTKAKSFYINVLCDFTDEDGDPTKKGVGLHSGKDRYIFSQYTEKKDDNDKKIFEGDIIKVKASKHFENDYNGVVIKQEGKYLILYDFDGCPFEDTLFSGYIEGIEVIGNIFENQEILTKTNDKK